MLWGASGVKTVPMSASVITKEKNGNSTNTFKLPLQRPAEFQVHFEQLQIKYVGMNLSTKTE